MLFLILFFNLQVSSAHQQNNNDDNSYFSSFSHSNQPQYADNYSVEKFTEKDLEMEGVAIKSNLWRESEDHGKYLRRNLIGMWSSYRLEAHFRVLSGHGLLT